jgi:hypothetical protein
MVLTYEVPGFMLMPIHKLSDDQLLKVFKPIHRTSEFASSNHHQSHLQVHSSSEKYAHLNHHHHHLFVFVNKHHLFHNLLHLFFLKDHHNHQLQWLAKQLFVV